MNSKGTSNRSVIGIVVLVLLLVGGYAFYSNSSKSPPTAPLKASFRASAISGLVLQVQNTSGEYLSCKMWARNSTLNETTSYSFSLDPYKMTEIGILECGWSFQSGESVYIKTEGFADYSFAVP